MEYSNSHARASLDILALLNPAVVPVAAPTTRSSARHRRDVEPDPVGQEYAEPVEAVAAAAPARTLVAAPPAAAPEHTEVPFEVDFGIRRGPQRVALLALLAVLPATGYTGWQAWQTQSPTWVGAGVILAGLTLALWVIRTTMRPAHLHLRDGILTITRGVDRYSWDLAHHSSPVLAVHGRPGRRGWRVVLNQVHGEPVRIDASMVDPAAFMQMLRAFLPEV